MIKRLILFMGGTLLSQNAYAAVAGPLYFTIGMMYLFPVLLSSLFFKERCKRTSIMLHLGLVLPGFLLLVNARTLFWSLFGAFLPVILFVVLLLWNSKMPGD